VKIFKSFQTQELIKKDIAVFVINKI